MLDLKQNLCFILSETICKTTILIMVKSFVSLGVQLKNCPDVVTLGLRPAFYLYSDVEKQFINKADLIFFPSFRYVDLFQAVRKSTYPSPSCYHLANNMLKQSILFKLTGIPHPKTTICIPRDGMDTILISHSLPFCGIRYKEKIKSRRRVKIATRSDLVKYLDENKLCLFREFIPENKIFRVIVMDYEIVYSYCCKRNPCMGTWEPSYGSVPEEAEIIVGGLASSCNLNHFVGNLTLHKGKPVLLDINCILPDKELRKLGFDPYRWLCQRISSGKFSIHRS